MENDLKEEKIEAEKDKNYSRGNKLSFNKVDNEGKKLNYGYQKKRNFFSKKKVCFFCQKRIFDISYFSTDILKRYITDRGKIIPGRYTGNCPKHQRIVKKVIKQARMLALLSFCSN